MPPCFQHEHHFCQQMFLSFSSCLPSTYKNKTPYPRLNKAWQNKSNFCIVYLYVDLWACPLLTYVDLCWTMLTYGPVLEGEVRRKESKHIFSDDGTLLDLILLHIYIFFFQESNESRAWCINHIHHPHDPKGSGIFLCNILGPWCWNFESKWVH